MIFQNDVLEAVTALLHKKYPQEKVYTNWVPNQFQRPSFLVENNVVSVLPSTGATITLRLTVHICCFEVVDDYHNSQLERLNVRQMAVLGLFAPLFLRVKDRALHVVSLEGSCGGRDWTDVTVVLEWDEEIAAFEEIKTLPMMKEINLILEGNT